MVKIKKILLVATVFICMFCTSIWALDDVLTNPDLYKPTDQIVGQEQTRIEGIINKILTLLTDAGIVISIVSVAIIGIKYMVGSVEEKAKYKESLGPYVIGIMLLFGILTVVKILQAVGEKINA